MAGNGTRRRIDTMFQGNVWDAGQAIETPEPQERVNQGNSYQGNSGRCLYCGTSRSHAGRFREKSSFLSLARSCPGRDFSGLGDSRPSALG